MVKEIARLDIIINKNIASWPEIHKRDRYKWILERSGKDWDMYRAQFPRNKTRRGKSPYRPVK
jgi:hypothetical protein